MPIKINEIEKGWLYKTPNNQERITLGFTVQNKAVYATRGGNVLNPFSSRESCSLERFAEACHLKECEVDEQYFNNVKNQCNANNLELCDKPNLEK